MIQEKALPTRAGIYACRQWYGWRILEWKSGCWVYVGGTASWPMPREVFEAIAGPLPAPSPTPVKPAALEFDL